MGNPELLGTFEYLVTQMVVHLGANAYGVKIRREILDRTGRDVSIGALYTTLRRLEKKGYLASRVGEVTPIRGGRAKTYFRITAPGQTVLRDTELAFARIGGFELAGARP